MVLHCNSVFFVCCDKVSLNELNPDLPNNPSVLSLLVPSSSKTVITILLLGRTSLLGCPQRRTRPIASSVFLPTLLAKLDSSQRLCFVCPWLVVMWRSLRKYTAISHRATLHTIWLMLPYAARSWNLQGQNNLHGLAPARFWLSLPAVTFTAGANHF